MEETAPEGAEQHHAEVRCVRCKKVFNHILVPAGGPKSIAGICPECRFGPPV